MSAGAIVLAAGAGRRFGGAKQIALWRGRPLLAWALDAALGAAALRPVVVVLGAHAAAVREAVDLSDVLVAEAADWEEGQAASLRAGVTALGDRDAAVVLLADMPAVTAEVVASVLAQWTITQRRRAAVPDALRTAYAGRPSHPVVLGRKALERVSSLRGDVGARALFSELRVDTWEAGHLCDPADIDTPKQLEVLA